MDGGRKGERGKKWKEEGRKRRRKVDREGVRDRGRKEEGGENGKIHCRRDREGGQKRRTNIGKKGKEKKWEREGEGSKGRKGRMEGGKEGGEQGRRKAGKKG